jgi:hypothetical protein
VTFGGFHNASEKGRASVHQIFANLGKSATEIITVTQQVFGDQILSHTQLFQWYVRFKISHTAFDEHTAKLTSCTNPETVP